MNRCQLLLSISIVVVMTFPTGCAVSRKDNQATLPGTTLSDGLLSFTAWDQETPGLGMALKAHDSHVADLAVSPEGTLAASVSYNTIRFWRLPEFTAAAALERLPANGLSLAFSPDGKALAIGLQDGSIRVLTVPDGGLMTSWQTRPPGEMGSANNLAFSPDGTLLVTGGDRKATVWSFPQGQLLQTLQHRSGVVHSVAVGEVAGSGVTVATAAGTGTDIHLWSPRNGRQTATLHGVAPSAFLPDGKVIIWRPAESGKTLEFWSLNDGHMILQLEEDGGAKVTVSPDGKLLATMWQGQVRLWKWPSGELVAKLPGDRVAFSGDGKILAAASSRDLQIWSLPTAAPAATRAAALPARRGSPRPTPAKAAPPLSAEPTLVRTIEIPSADGSFARIDLFCLDAKGETVATSVGKTIDLWSVQNGTRYSTVAGETDVAALAFSADSRTLFSADWRGTIRLWTAPEGKPSATLIGHERVVTGIQVSPDGTMLVSASTDNTVRVWSCADGKTLTKLETQFGVNLGDAPKVSPDGRFLALKGRVWSLPHGKPLETPFGHVKYIQSLAIAPGGELLLSASDTEIKVWSLRDGRPKTTVEYAEEEGVEKHRGAMAISRDGRLLATIESLYPRGEDGDRRRGTRRDAHDVRLSRLPDLKPITRLRHQDAVTSLAFSPDSGVLVTGDRFGIISRWDLQKMGIRP